MDTVSAQWAGLAAIWTDPATLGPVAIPAEATRDIADLLVRRLDAHGHSADQVLAFLMRPLFTMLTEDIRKTPLLADCVDPCRCDRFRREFVPRSDP